MSEYSTAPHSTGRMACFDKNNIDVNIRRQCNGEVNLDRKGRDFLWHHSNNFTNWNGEQMSFVKILIIKMKK